MGRERLEMISAFPFPPDTAIISITDTDAGGIILKHRPQHLLRLSFNDITDDVLMTDRGQPYPLDKTKAIIQRYRMFTEEHARSIAGFFSGIRDSADMLICQCEFGQSRSAAVAAAILEYTEGRGGDIFTDSRYSPNRKVYGMLLHQLQGLTAIEQ